MKNILVCDDDTAIVDSIEIYLQQEGYQVFKAYDGIQALEELKKNEIQLINHKSFMHCAVPAGACLCSA